MRGIKLKYLIGTCRWITARSKGKVERPFRRVKETQEPFITFTNLKLEQRQINGFFDI